MLDDRQVELAPGKDLVQPLRPLDVLDVDANADVSELRGDDLAGSSGVGAGWQAHRKIESIGEACFCQQRPGTIRVVRKSVNKVDIATILPAEVAADGFAKAEQRAFNDGVAINGIAKRLPHP